MAQIGWNSEGCRRFDWVAMGRLWELGTLSAGRGLGKGLGPFQKKKKKEEFFT